MSARLHSAGTQRVVGTFLSEKSKHFAIDELYIRQHIEDGTIVVKYIDTTLNLADPMTKPYSIQKLAGWYKSMGIVVKDSAGNTVDQNQRR